MRQRRHSFVEYTSRAKPENPVMPSIPPLYMRVQTKKKDNIFTVHVPFFAPREPCALLFPADANQP